MIAWTVWTADDVHDQEIHLIWILAFAPLLFLFQVSWINALFIPVYLALLAWNQRQKGFKRGDDYMLAAYGLSTLYAPLTALFALPLVAGIYIYIGKQKWENAEDLEDLTIYFAPAFQLAAFLTLVLYTLQVIL
mgnify:CR=1 FL=1